jgi:hypothetical protein
LKNSLRYFANFEKKIGRKIGFVIPDNGIDFGIDLNCFEILDVFQRLENLAVQMGCQIHNFFNAIRKFQSKTIFIEIFHISHEMHFSSSCHRIDPVERLFCSREYSIFSIPKLRPVRPEVAGIAAEAAAGDEAEGFEAQCFGHFGDEPFQLEAGGVRVFLELRPQKQFSAEPREMVRGHVKIFVCGALAMAQIAIHAGVFFGPPIGENFRRPGQDCGFHVMFALFPVHFRPGQRLALGSKGSNDFGIATHHKKRRQTSDDDPAENLFGQKKLPWLVFGKRGHGLAPKSFKIRFPFYLPAVGISRNIQRLPKAMTSERISRHILIQSPPAVI